MRLSAKDGNEGFLMTPLEVAICGMVDKIEMILRLTVMKSFKTEELGMNPS
jgi:hypothetical protein